MTDQHCVDGPDSLYYLLQRLMIVVPIILGICTIAFAFLIRRLHEQFGWAVFHLVGASLEMKSEPRCELHACELILYEGCIRNIKP